MTAAASSSTDQSAAAGAADKAREAAAKAKATTDAKPEIVVGAAFAGAFLFAKLLKRLGR